MTLHEKIHGAAGRIAARVGRDTEIVCYQPLIERQFALIKYHFHNGYITGTSKIETADTLDELVSKIELRFLPIATRKESNE